MDVEELRNIQAPIKEKYRVKPAYTEITLKAYGKIGQGITCRVKIGKAMIEAGFRHVTCGNGKLACAGNVVGTAIVIKITYSPILAEHDLETETVL